MTTNYRALMNEARNENKTNNKVQSIPAKKYGTRSRIQAKRYDNTTSSTSTTAWDQADDATTSYDEMEAAFWS